MITKTHKVDLGLGVPEKKKKKKKKKKVAVVKEPETQYSVLNSDAYFSDISPTRPRSPSDNVGQEQVLEMPLGKKKKKKKDHHTLCKAFPEPETLAYARLTNPPSPRNQVLDQLECLSGEKKKKRKSLSLAASQSSDVKTSPDPKQGKEVSRAGKKLKKHKKEKKTQVCLVSTEDPWLCEAGDALYAASMEREEAEEQAALGQKCKQDSPREHSVKKKKKKKKAHQESNTLLVYSKQCRSVETSPGRGRRKNPVEAGALDYIPVGDSLKSPGKKKGKSKKRVQQPVEEELAVKTKKKKRKECRAAEAPLEEEEVSDADLEVVLEKKGNVDETYIDQVRRKALQEEIDRESGKTEALEPRKWTGTQFGQWDTAGFENEEQKLKFLKLMGGFKHLSTSLSPPPNMTRRPNMALSKKAADTLQQNLQQDYDRAMSWKCSRGAGLGFTTTTNKIFYIDRNASKSVKFDD